MGSSLLKYKPFRLVALLLALIMALLICGASSRMRYAARNPWLFERREVSFSNLLLYACDLHRRPSAPVNSCINNLRQIDGAKQQWALETKASSNATPTWADIRPYLGRGSDDWVYCPAGGFYILHDVSSAPTCTIKGHSLQ
jgi:hypothetical protein